MERTAASGLDLKATPPFGNSARVSLSEVLAAEGEDRDTRLFGEAIDALAACTQE